MLELLIYLAVLGASLALLIRAGMYVVHSLSSISRFLGLSEFLISFVLLSLATSLSELSVGISSAISGIPNLSLGDIFGTNMVNLTLIVGLVAVAGGGLKIKDYKTFNKGRWFVVLLVIAPFILIIDGRLSRIDGIILIALFLINLFRIIKDKEEIIEEKVWKTSLSEHARAEAKDKKDFFKKLGLFIAGVALLLLSAYGAVFAIKEISLFINIPHFLLGILLVGIGTSLPELSVGIRSVKSKKGGVSLGNILGAITINSTLVLGVVSLIHPIIIPEFYSLVTVGGFTMLSIFLIYFFMREKNKISVHAGFVLLLIYVVFLLIEIVFA